MKRCIAVTLDGRRCNDPALFWDTQRCGPTCSRHSRSDLDIHLLDVLEEIGREVQATYHPSGPGRPREAILRSRGRH